jgi:TATA-binding protein-associated factor Taf7
LNLLILSDFSDSEKDDEDDEDEDSSNSEKSKEESDSDSEDEDEEKKPTFDVKSSSSLFKFSKKNTICVNDTSTYNSAIAKKAKEWAFQINKGNGYILLGVSITNVINKTSLNYSGNENCIYWYTNSG